MKSKTFKYKKQILVVILALCNLSILLMGCKKDEEVKPAFETGTMTDVDNNVYKTIKIGNQWWMAENLKVKHFRNGVPVAEAQASQEWMNGNAAFCNYDNSATAPGLLYNWNVIADTNRIAPAGWHVPNDVEWKELEKFLGMSESEANSLGWRGDNVGEKLKMEGTQGWTIYPDVWPTNESGFTALAGSCRLEDGTFGNPGLFATGFWWTSSQADATKAWYRYLDYKTSTVFRSKTSIEYGFSIRCVKD